MQEYKTKRELQQINARIALLGDSRRGLVVELNIIDESIKECLERRSELSGESPTGK